MQGFYWHSGISKIFCKNLIILVIWSQNVPNVFLEYKPLLRWSEQWFFILGVPMRKFISNNKDIRCYVSLLLQSGSADLYKGKKHAYLIINGRRLIIPGSPSCRRSFDNFRSDVQRTIDNNGRVTC